MSSGNLIKVTCYIVLSEVMYQVVRRIYKKFKYACNKSSLTYSLKQLYSEPSDKSATFNKVIFFPDPGIACRRMLSGRVCRYENCTAIHDETSLTVLLNILNLSKRTLDICVYMITCSILADALIDCHRKGIALRIITEERNSGEEGEMTGSQVGKLRAAAVQVCCKSSSFLMHHKFLIADNEVLVNGSFNWTNQAVMGNSENLIITNEKTLVDPFVSEFQKLWDDLVFQDNLEDEDIKNCNVLNAI